ncbi:hypothetical protein NPIL_21031, partial [Nephila pilipes]
MLSYCRSDVDILRRCCMVFREQFMEIANVDPFRYVTIASACMATYRRRRQVAKLALNSFWGRWGMNLNKTKLSYVSSVPDFNRYLSDPTKKIKDIFLPSEE